MFVADIFCKGPFDFGKGGDCPVRIGILRYVYPKTFERNKNSYHCSVCGAANTVLRPLVAAMAVPWWDPDWVRALDAALDGPRRVWPSVAIPEGKKEGTRMWRKHDRAVLVALSKVVRDMPPLREVEHALKDARLRTLRFGATLPSG